MYNLGNLLPNMIVVLGYGCWSSSGPGNGCSNLDLWRRAERRSHVIKCMCGDSRTDVPHHRIRRLRMNELVTLYLFGAVSHLDAYRSITTATTSSVGRERTGPATRNSATATTSGKIILVWTKVDANTVSLTSTETIIAVFVHFVIVKTYWLSLAHFHIQPL